ncbi:Os01g0109201 [Oryza sativa Japonica Group]|uniref:Os01g0109201 protein n=1 Tax=Oryza sativa subsp. japonica TaxID=39947 RepID=A0A0P0UXX0_ORYSJ|nr:hypothetical protein EE612_004354 [Oryza sativa]BAS69996.1 Os01g0109201 [Oryza sativa Japonica Group]
MGNFSSQPKSLKNLMLSRGLSFPRVKSILTLLTATSSSFSSTLEDFCEQTMSCAVIFLKCSSLSFGTEYSLQNL